MPEISIVTSLYKSEKYLDEFISKCYETLHEINCSDFEIIVVNDGSPDDSLEKILQIKNQYVNIKVIDLSRNFGHHYAFFAGMKYSKGNFVFNIDCDLEVKPSVLKTFYHEVLNKNYDVVYGYQESRKGYFIEKISGRLFWKLFNYLSETKIPDNILTERLMTRKYVCHLVELGDKNLFLAGLMSWAGFKQKGIALKKSQRENSSTYSFNKKVSLLIEAISSFSGYPLKLLFKTGIIITFFSFIYGSLLILQKLIYPGKIELGYTSVIVVILFSTGLIIASLGIIGIYIEKIFNQVKNRPLYIIKDIYE
jgi:putative glycosyltransferase